MSFFLHFSSANLSRPLFLFRYDAIAKAFVAWMQRRDWGWWLSLKWSRSAPGYPNRLNGPVGDLQGPWAVGVTVGSCLLRAFQSVPHANPFSLQLEQVQRRIWMPLDSVTGGEPTNPARKALHFQKGKVCLFQYTMGFFGSNDPLRCLPSGFSSALKSDIFIAFRALV